MVISREGVVDCGACPLDGMRKVWGRIERGTPSFVLVGEAPGKDEDKTGKPFQGRAGQLLRRALDDIGVDENEVYFMNTIACRPPNNNFQSNAAFQAKKCCSPGFDDEIRQLVYGYDVKVFVPLGNSASERFQIKDNITRAKGSIYLRHIAEDGSIHEEPKKGTKEVFVVPTYHPSYIQRGNWKEEPTWKNNLNKAYGLVEEGWTALKENFNLFPTIEDLYKFEKGLKKGQLLALDIETAFSLDPRESEIICVGLAKSESDCLVLPFFGKGMKPYWKSNSQYNQAREWLKKIVGTYPLLIQNALFDVAHLEAHGYKVGKIAHDIMLMHHAIHPELPHRLDYIVSVYGKTPYWKGEFLGKMSAVQKFEDEEFRRYNARDTVVLHQVLQPMIDDLEDSGTSEVYHKFSMRLIRPILEMMTNGMKVDTKKLSRINKYLTKLAYEKKADLYKDFDLPDSFNVGSSDDMKWLLYGIEPPKFQRARDKKKKYEENSKLRRDTKAYQELLNIEKLFNIQIMPDSGAQISKTKNGKKDTDLATDEKQLNRIDIAANNRIRRIDELKKPKKEHQEEKKELERLRKFIKAHRYIKKIETQLNTFTEFPISSDGRVHTKYKIHGTATGRLSSADVNLQNIPKDSLGLDKKYQIRSTFVAEEGWKLVQADYSNLELRILAVVCKDEKMLDVFRHGLNMHDQNTRILFGIDESHPEWKLARGAAKTYIFGRNYGGGLKGIYERVMAQVPDFSLTFSDFSKADERYRSTYKGYNAWRDDILERVGKVRMLRNPFGRLRIFLGEKYQIEKEGLNFPIQSCGADIVNTVLINLYEKLKGVEDKKMIGTVHDSIMLEVKNDSVDEACYLLKEFMEIPFDIDGEEVVFPVDLEVGDNWAEMKPWSPDGKT